MKKFKNNIKFFALLMLFLQACETDVLDATAPDRYSDAAVWSDVNLANTYLLKTYDDLSMGYGAVMIESVSDNVRHEFTWGPQNYVQGNITPDNFEPWVRAWNKPEMITWIENFQAIQTINVFLANIDKVPEAYEGNERETVQQQVDVLKGEAHFMRAFSYAQLARTFGGVPVLREPNERSDDFMSITRSTFEETIQFISDDYDSAAGLLLSDGEMEMGRATKGAALALKSRILLFAASDLTADGSVANELVGYSSPDGDALWTAARDAAKAVIDLGTYNLADLGAPDQEAVAQNYYDFFRQKTLSNNEIIWGKMYLKGAGDANQMNLWNGANGNNNWAGHNPTQGLVDNYQMEDGSNFFDHFEINSEDNYVNVSGQYESENIYHNREPRFYGSILYDGALWQPRFPNLVGRDPVGIYDRRTRITIENGEVTSQVFGIDTRQGPVENWNGSFTGYIMKKLLDEDITGKDENNDNVWIEVRYAEILLNYAEALLELGNAEEAAVYINMIRNRAGMPDFTGDITDALRYERRQELAFEGHRWYDIRRWKILEEELTDAMGIDIVEIKENGNVTTSWERILTEDREVGPRMYWVPIPTNEINKAPQLEQNPGY